MSADKRKFSAESPWILRFSDLENPPKLEGSAVIAKLKACARKKDLHTGLSVHADILKRGLLGKKTSVVCALIAMYARCGQSTKAKEVFDDLQVHTVITWSALIAEYAQSVHHGEEALKCFEQMQSEGLYPDAITLTCVLKACGLLGALDKGEHVHFEISRQGLLDEDIVLGSVLVDMYVKCGVLSKAKEVFESLPVRNAVSWSAMITAYAQANHGKQAFDCFEQMQHEGVSSDAVSFVCALRACGMIGALEKGESIHYEIVHQGLLGQNVVLDGALVDMYAKCGALWKAKELLEGLPMRDVAMWNALITGYVQGVNDQEALNCFACMQADGLSPDEVTFICALKACGSLGALDGGKGLHARMTMHGLLGGNILIAALVDMYVKCGSFVEAEDMLEKFPSTDVTPWSSLIVGFASFNHCDEALSCYENMQCKGFSPDAVTIIGILKACGSMRALDKGEIVHSEIVKQGLLEEHGILGNALVDMYIKCGALKAAKGVFERLPIRDVITWSALIVGYAEGKHAKEAVNFLGQMQHEGLFPNAVTFACVLKACGNVGALEDGKNIHYEITRQRLVEVDVVLGAALVDMYAKCGALAKAKEVLEGLHVRNTVSWSVLIAGYAERELGEEALNCFDQMQREGHLPDAVTFACILSACGSIKAIDKGIDIHSKIAQHDMLLDNAVLGSALVDMYAKCGANAKAAEVLEGLHDHTVAAWNALIAGYVQGDHNMEALDSYRRMQCEGLFPNEATFVCMLKTCGNVGAVELGENIHSKIVNHGFLGINCVIGNALLDMYSRCGAVAKVREVLEQLPVRDVVAWSVLIAGCGQGEDAYEALRCFEQMNSEGVYPDDITFLCILRACNHIGLLDEAQQCFTKMNTSYGIISDPEHFTCIVNLLGSMGFLEKALAVLKNMPFYGHLPAWLAFLNACKKWGNMMLGKWAFEHGVHLDMKCSAHLYKNYTAGFVEGLNIVKDIGV